MDLLIWIGLFWITALHRTEAADSEVTCGSAIKLLNSRYDVRLSSPDATYGSGSGQRTVTGNPNQLESGANWQVKGNATSFCPRGRSVSCGQVIRLENLGTGKNLHSHNYRSPLSGGLEVSIYGQDGVGDTGDHWQVMCNTEFWLQEQKVMFRHVDTKTYLEATGHEYSDPHVERHVEIAGTLTTGPRSMWRTAEGVFIKPGDPPIPAAHQPNIHTEL
uniref:Stromal cell-derived factor 2 n=1 Tax=Lygus hesperus TaxID=30085 RepID=A0A0A9YNP1_LYGHE